MIQNLVFCFPYRGMGGVPFTFGRLAAYLQAQKNCRYKLYLIDYPDGFMAVNREDDRVRLIPYSDEEACQVPERSLMVFQSMTPWSIFPSMKVPPSTRLMFWNLYPYNLVPVMPGFRELMYRNPSLSRLVLRTLLFPFASRMREFLSVLLENQAVAFMDVPNLRATEAFLGVSIETPSFVPVGMASTAEVSRKAHRADELVFTWVGRLADFKAHSIARVALDVAEVANREKVHIRFDIIGEGERKFIIEEAVRQIGEQKYFSLCFRGAIPPREVEEYLGSETDLVFGMGGSAIEPARLGVPVILLDVSYSPLPKDYKYKFLHEARGYSVGEILGIEGQQDGLHPMSEIVARLRENPKRESQLVRDYFERNHSLRVTSLKFLDFAQRVRLTWGELEDKGLLERPLAYRALQYLRELTHSTRPGTPRYVSKPERVT